MSCMACGFCAFISPNGRLFHKCIWFSRVFRKTWTQLFLSEVTLELRKQVFLCLSLLLAGVTDIHLRRLLIGLESRECCRLWRSSTSFSSCLLAAARFAVSQTPVLQVSRNCPCEHQRSRLLVLTWAPSGTELLTTVHRPEERLVLSQEFVILSGQRAGEMEQQNEAAGEGNAGGAV